MGNLIVPIFSMRSYETGLYSVLKDGNFQLHLHRASEDDVICVPFDIADQAELISLFPNHVFIQIKYGKNAEETRQNFWKWNSGVIEATMEDYNLTTMVTDITGVVTDYVPFIYNCNICKDPELDRPYIDKYFETDVQTCHNAIKVFVLNESQKRSLVAAGVQADKIIVSQRVVKPSVIQRYLDSIKEPFVAPKHDIFFPFRISDKCYAFEDVLQFGLDHHKRILITDPNDTYTGNHQHVVKQRLSKLEYYSVLSEVPTVVYNEDPEKVFHPGLGELIYFGADIISEYNIPTPGDITIEGDNFWQS
ncbi:conserved hypothetical phage protein [Acinetobacter phage Ac42]|uniref:hypothetical protein n=1 Tax=Acinetobacter phage Ac42 TaxID=762660 RepID=UPI0001EBCCE6|nr:hypothetical protein Ac42p076 [Acinetobacter phage Ac42]ADI96314.1 conserved hypothetical phage protein [Acinetobacter phage Ac42]